MSIQCDRISFAFKQNPIITELSLILPDAGIVGISGPSGCGKTTLLHLLAGLISPQAGRIKESQRKRIGVVFQEDRLLPWLTNEANIQIVCGDQQSVHHWLERMELSQVAARYPNELSGGMRRRVALARALAFDCDLLLLDEPFQGMDQPLKERLYPLILQTAKHKPVVMVSHDWAELSCLADTLYRASGPPLHLSLA